MINYFLKKHKKFEWHQDEELYYRCGFNCDEDLIKKFADKCIEEDLDVKLLGNMLNEINGNFSLIIRSPKNIYLCADRTQSFPLLYSIINDDVIISDSISKIQETGKCAANVSVDVLEEFVSMGVALGKNTLYDDVFVVEAAQIVKINLQSKQIETCDYFLHEHGEYFKSDNEELAEILDKTLHNVFSRIKEKIGERLIVVPLSGGYDSRLVVTFLKREGIENVLCISYGTYKTKEVQVARQLARELGYDWMYVPQTKKEIVRLAHNKSFWKCMKDISNSSAIPYLQNFSIYKLKKSGVIPSDAVVMTGNSGDVLEGDQMPECFESEKNYTRKELLDAIINKHFRLAGRKGASNIMIREKITERYLQKDIYSYEEVHNIFEQFNWRERQSQFLFNDGLFYSDFCGLEWYFPLWDSEFVDFWLHVPTQLRYKRKFYYYYVNKETLKTANDPTLYQKSLGIAKEKMYKLLVRFYNFKRIAEYDLKGDCIWHLLCRKDYLRMLLWTGGVGTNSNSAVIWALLDKCFGIDVGKIKLRVDENNKLFDLK